MTMTYLDALFATISCKRGHCSLIVVQWGVAITWVPNVVSSRLLPAQALVLLQSKGQAVAASQWFELPTSTSGVEGFCDVEQDATSWELCRSISAATDCASKTGCVWSSGDPFPGFCGVRDDPASEMQCKKSTQPTDCVSASCQWYRFPMGPGPVRWTRWVSGDP